MNATSGDDARARFEGKRLAHAVVVAIAVAFIGASAVQIVPAVFGTQTQLVSSTPAGLSDRACAEDVHSLMLALDRATGQAWSPRAARAVSEADEDAVIQAFRQGLAPEWNADATIAQACAKSREGFEAWAALLRLRRAEEQVVLRGFVELVPLRRDVTAHLPADLR